MPPFADVLATDSELAILYKWLNGSEAVDIPLPVTIELQKQIALPAESQRATYTIVQVSATRSETNTNVAAPPETSLRYRLRLAEAHAPAANQLIEFQRSGVDTWLQIKTDDRGEALLSPEQGFDLMAETRKKPATLRMTLSPARYALTLEAISEPPNSVVGIGTTILRVE